MGRRLRRSERRRADAGEAGRCRGQIRRATMKPPRHREATTTAPPHAAAHSRSNGHARPLPYPRHPASSKRRSRRARTIGCHAPSADPQRQIRPAHIATTATNHAVVTSVEPHGGPSRPQPKPTEAGTKEQQKPPPDAVGRRPRHHHASPIPTSSREETIVGLVARSPGQPTAVGARPGQIWTRTTPAPPPKGRRPAATARRQGARAPPPAAKQRNGRPARPPTRRQAPRQPDAPARRSDPRPAPHAARGKSAPPPPMSAGLCPAAPSGGGGGGRPEGEARAAAARVCPRGPETSFFSSCRKIMWMEIHVLSTLKVKKHSSTY
ncbi:formin-like protein 16 [Triticum aestivum]|uniref:formin-like protein 16 n=1 Tax=Triticum aestivum TaxID=4565 RepID=UPI001D03555B|nr:formin-like protein 16 [Triticum aestivum]